MEVVYKYVPIWDSKLGWKIYFYFNTLLIYFTVYYATCPYYVLLYMRGVIIM